MMRKFAHLLLILGLSACATTSAPDPLPQEQMLLGTWTCSTENGRALGTTEYKPDGTFFGDDRFTLPSDEAGDQMTIHLHTNGEWHIESDVLIDSVVDVRFVGAETSGQQLAGKELETIKRLIGELFSSSLKDDSTSHSDILVLTDEKFTNTDRDTKSTTTCSREPQAS